MDRPCRRRRWRRCHDSDRRLASREGESQTQASQNFCSSLDTLDSSLTVLTDLSPTGTSKENYQAAVSEVRSNWDAVKSDNSDLQDVTTSELDDAWGTFESAVQGVPEDASVGDALNDVSSATQTLRSSVKSTLSGPDCS
jgi:hypothetical protein